MFFWGFFLAGFLCLLKNHREIRNRAVKAPAKAGDGAQPTLSPPPYSVIQIKWNDIQTNPKLFLFLQNQNLSDEVLRHLNTNHSSLSIIDMRLNSNPFIWDFYPLWTWAVWLKMEPGFKPSPVWVVQITT